jgi:hypothetical protein
MNERVLNVAESRRFRGTAMIPWPVSHDWRHDVPLTKCLERLTAELACEVHIHQRESESSGLLGVEVEADGEGQATYALQQIVDAAQVTGAGYVALG